jgi:hypothetical protein
LLSDCCPFHFVLFRLFPLFFFNELTSVFCLVFKNQPPLS